MLKQPMIEKLFAMRLHGMAESLKALEQDPAARELSFLERLGLLVDQQWDWRKNQPGLAHTKTCLCWDQPVWAKALWLAPWLRRRAATGTRLSTPAPNRYFATWRWRVQMAASAVYWHGLAASTFW